MIKTLHNYYIMVLLLKKKAF